MSLELYFKHVFVNGVHKAELIKFRALKKDQLPNEYLSGDYGARVYEHCVFGTRSLLVYEAREGKCLKCSNYRVGEVVDLDEMKWIVATVGKAGHRLYGLNKKINAEKAKFEGKIEKFVF